MKAFLIAIAFCCIGISMASAEDDEVELVSACMQDALETRNVKKDEVWVVFRCEGPVAERILNHLSQQGHVPYNGFTNFGTKARCASDSVQLPSGLFEWKYHCEFGLPIGS